MPQNLIPRRVQTRCDRPSGPAVLGKWYSARQRIGGNGNTVTMWWEALIHLDSWRWSKGYIWSKRTTKLMLQHSITNLIQRRIVFQEQDISIDTSGLNLPLHLCSCSLFRVPQKQTGSCLQIIHTSTSPVEFLGEFISCRPRGSFKEEVSENESISSPQKNQCRAPNFTYWPPCHRNRDSSISPITFPFRASSLSNGYRPGQKK